MPRKSLILFLSGCCLAIAMSASTQTLLCGQQRGSPSASIADPTVFSEIATSFPQLAGLSIHNCPDFRDLRFLANSALTRLWVANCPIDDLAPLAQLTSLEQLTLRGLGKYARVVHHAGISALRFDDSLKSLSGLPTAGSIRLP